MELHLLIAMKVLSPGCTLSQSDDGNLYGLSDVIGSWTHTAVKTPKSYANDSKKTDT